VAGGNAYASICGSRDMQGTFVSTRHVFVQLEMQEAVRGMLDRGTVSFDPAVMQRRAVPPQLRMLPLGAPTFRTGVKSQSRDAETLDYLNYMVCSDLCSCLKAFMA
jgi:hypothetical protein